MPNRFRDQEQEELALLGPPHPGEILREDIWPQLKMSKKAAAKKMNVSRSAVSNLLNERRRVSRHLAAGLAEISGISVIYWLVLQAHHDAWQMERDGYCRHPVRASDSGSKRVQKARICAVRTNPRGRSTGYHRELASSGRNFLIDVEQRIKPRRRASLSSR
jgi:addiction module HigA family antidote